MNSPHSNDHHRLRLFGGLSLERSDGPATGPAAQRHKLALMALLARAPGNQVTREKLMAVLWPESDEEHARGLLNAAVYAIRKALGPDVLLSTRETVRLAPAHIAVDTIHFDELVRGEKLEEAAELYRGAFLDGFHLQGSQEFDAWAHAERDELAGRHRKVLEQLAETSRPRAALEWRRRLVAESPYSPTAALRYMGALEAAGEWPQALSFASEYEELLLEDLGVRADARVEALAEAIRSRHEVDYESTLPPVDEPLPGPPRRAHFLDFVERIPRMARRTPRTRPALVGLAALAVAWFVFVPFGQRAGGVESQGDPHRIAVFPFDIQADASLDYLGEGMVDLLSAKLNRMGPVTTVDPAALTSALPATPAATPDFADEVSVQLGAGHYVTGSVIDLGGTLELRAVLHRRGGDAIGEATARGLLVNLPQSVDALSRRLLSEQLAQTGESFGSLAAETTDSLSALRAYLEGEQSYRRGAYDEAASHFEAATNTDANFALAWYRLGRARDLAGAETPWWENAVDARAAGLADRLPPLERTLIEAALLRPAEAVPLLTELTLSEPTHAEAHFQLGRTLIRTSLGGLERDQSAAVALGVALTLDPRHTAARSALAFSLARLGEWSRLSDLIGSGGGDGGDPDPRLYLAIGEGNEPAVSSLLDQLRGFRAESLLQLGPELAVLFPDSDAAQRVYELATEASRPDFVRGDAHRRLADLALARGQWSEARKQLDRAEQAYGGPVIPGRARLGILPNSPVSPSELRAIRSELVAAFTEQVRLEGRPGGVPGLAMNAGLVSARLDDVAGVRDAIRMLESLEGSPDEARVPFLVASLEAEIAWLRGDAQQVVDILTDLGEPNANQRYLMARALEAVGRGVEALAWYASYPDLSQNAAAQLGWRAASLVHSARIQARRGATAEAARLYEDFLMLWSDADPELQPLVVEARGEMLALR